MVYTDFCPLYFLNPVMKKTTTTPEKPVSKAKVKQPIAAEAAQAPLKKAGTNPKSPKKAQAATPKPVAATPEVPAPERVGLTAGSIWHYLNSNGSTSVAKLIRELAEDEKTIQRGIGWLAQEDKTSLDTVDRVETIALKG
jgi:hypothetical protein